MKMNDLIQKLKAQGIDATAEQIERVIGSPEYLGDDDLPGIVELIQPAGKPARQSKTTSGLAKRTGKLAKADESSIQQSTEQQSAPVPVTASTRIDSAAYQSDLSTQIAQPLIDADRQVTALEQGLMAAAQHLSQRKQNAVDGFYRAVAEPAQTQELQHFFSQIPEEFRIFFPSTSGN